MKDGSTTIVNGRHFFTVKEAAAFCGINAHTLYRLAKIPQKNGGPPNKRFGAAYRFPKTKFIAWAENHEGNT